VGEGAEGKHSNEKTHAPLDAEQGKNGCDCAECGNGLQRYSSSASGLKQCREEEEANQWLKVCASLKQDVISRPQTVFAKQRIDLPKKTRQGQRVAHGH